MGEFERRLQAARNSDQLRRSELEGEAEAKREAQRARAERAQTLLPEVAKAIAELQRVQPTSSTLRVNYFDFRSHRSGFLRQKRGKRGWNIGYIQVPPVGMPVVRIGREQLTIEAFAARGTVDYGVLGDREADGGTITANVDDELDSFLSAVADYLK